MIKYLKYSITHWLSWPCRIIPLFFGFVIWLSLHDLPPTSKGGFWYYFWPFYALYALILIAIEVVVHNDYKDDNE
jgi:hypothetical protein